MSGARELVILALRQSPDWKMLSQQYEEHGAVDPTEYIPPFRVPGFPQNLSDLIRTWNKRYHVNYFRCRERLKQISSETLRCVNNARVISYRDLPEILPDLDPRSNIFFFDDDDWFAPNVAEVCAAISDGPDFITFPLPLVGVGYLTLVDGADQYGRYLGRSRTFELPFHTNNYAITARILSCSADCLRFRDHVVASELAMRDSIKVAYQARVVSAAVKSPASAGSLQRLSDQVDFELHLDEFINELAMILPPPNLSWMRKPMRAVTDLFQDVRASRIGSRAKGVL